MCKIIFLHLQHVFMEEFGLFGGALIKNAMAELVRINAQDLQPGRKQCVSLEIRNIKSEADNVGIVEVKSPVFEGQSFGTDINNPDVYTLKPDGKSQVVLKTIPKCISQFIRIVRDDLSYRFLFFPEQIQLSCFVLCFLPMYWVPAAGYRHSLWQSSFQGLFLWKS